MDQMKSSNQVIYAPKLYQHQLTQYTLGSITDAGAKWIWIFVTVTLPIDKLGTGLTKRLEARQTCWFVSNPSALYFLEIK